MTSAPRNPQSPQQAPAAKGDEPIIRLVDLHKSFKTLHVLRGVSLDFRRGETTVVMGPSGTGKSVLLKLIAGLLKPDSGEVYFEGQRTDQLSEAEMVGVRKRMGFLFQLSALFDSMTVGDNIAFPLTEHTKMTGEQRREKVATVLNMVGLAGIEKKMPADLSGGQKKRVALARAIVLEPDVVLYDEPTTGLDPIRADVIDELIVSLQKRLGITSVVVTHDMRSADKVADRMVLLNDGKVIAEGTPEEFRANDNDVVRRFIEGKADKDDVDKIHAALDPIEEKRAGGNGG